MNLKSALFSTYSGFIPTIRQILPILIIFVFLLLLTACGSPKPPLTFAPDGDIVKRAIAVQLEQTQESLSDKLTTSLPELQISKVKINQLEPLYLGKLPTYHLQGDYHLTLKLSEEKVEQQDNQFDIYLQRQIEGKTWRLLKEESESEEWRSYSLQKF